MSLELLVILVVFLPISVNSETIRLEREKAKITLTPSTNNKILLDNSNLDNSVKKLVTNETSGRILNSKTKFKTTISVPVNNVSTTSSFKNDVESLKNIETTTQGIKLSLVSTPNPSTKNLTKLLPLKAFNLNNTVDNSLDKSEFPNDEKTILPMKNELNISAYKHDSLNNFNDITENITSPGNDDPINLEKTIVNVPVETEKSVNNSDSNSSNQILRTTTTRKYKLLDTNFEQKNENETNMDINDEDFIKKIFKSKIGEAPLLDNTSESVKNFFDKNIEKNNFSNKSEDSMKQLNISKSKIDETPLLVNTTENVTNFSDKQTTEINSLKKMGAFLWPAKMGMSVPNDSNETKSDQMQKTAKLLNNSSETIYNITENENSTTDNIETFSAFTTTAKSVLTFTSTRKGTVSPESSTQTINYIDTTKLPIESTTNNIDISVTTDGAFDNDTELDFYISTISLGLNDDIFQSTESPNFATQETKTEINDISNAPTTTESNFYSTLPQMIINNSIKFTTNIPKTFSTTKMADILIVDQTTEPTIKKLDIPEQKKELITEIPFTNDNMEGEFINETEPDYVWIAIGASAIGIIALICLIFVSCYYMKKRSKLTYGQRCRPVSLDAYSLDNISIHNSVRRREKNGIRASKKSFGNIAFDDPSLKHNAMGIHELAKFIEKKSTIYEEFRSIPQITARADEVPQGCEDKNRYANVIPLPETRVLLQRQNEDETTEYINANYVRGPKDSPNYYIACQAPIENTITDFWRMVWEQNCYVIIMATDIIENGIEKCAEYLPQSNFANSLVFDNFHIILKNREVKQKYAITTMNLKNSLTNTTREITHFWYKWPETGVPADESAIIAMLLEARSCLKMPPNEFSEVNGGNTNPTNDTNENNSEINIKMDKSKMKLQGPLIIHCSPGTGRTGTIIACDIAVRSLEQTRRTIDIPQFVYYIRRGRASAVQTKEQYEFIYRVSNFYATKISAPVNDN